MNLPAGWIPVSPAEGRGLENELRRELASSHRLFGRALRAVARHAGSDDVLFGHPDGRGEVCCVHLTWSVETDPRWPAAETFRDLDDFAQRWTSDDGGDAD